MLRRGNSQNNVPKRAAIRVQTKTTNHQQLKKLLHEANDTVPRRIRLNRSLETIPAHNFNLHVRRHVRVVHNVIAAKKPTEPSVRLSLPAIITATRFELGTNRVEPELGYEKFTVFGGRVFTMLSTQVTRNHTNNLSIFSATDETDPAENSIVAQFEFGATQSAAAHVEWVEPIRNRPVFDQDESDGQIYLDLYTDLNENDNFHVTIDIDVDYVRTIIRSSLLTELQKRIPIVGSNCPLTAADASAPLPENSIDSNHSSPSSVSSYQLIADAFHRERITLSDDEG